MARPIAPTPVLDKESSKKFLNQVAMNINRKTKPVPTPKITRTINRIMTDALNKEKRSS